MRIKNIVENVDLIFLKIVFMMHHKCSQAEARNIVVIAAQTKVILFARRSHGPILRLWSCDHEHKQ